MNPVEKVPTLAVGEFFTRHSEELQMQPLTEDALGFSRRIRQPTVNRPGLALCGFFSYFAEKRIQVMGSAELAYLKSLSAKEIRHRCDELCRRQIPCIIVARQHRVPPGLLEAAREHEVAVFSTPMVTMRFINAATLALEFEFASRKSEYGSMVDIRGMGVLIRGSSGVGKSECVIGLLERGYSLVSDDITHFHVSEGRHLLGTSAELTRNYMEVRGLGVINVTAIFGIGAVRQEKRLDLVVTLKEWQEIEEIDRTGLENEYYDILGLLIPHVTIPVRSGRDIARLVEVGALDHKLKSVGHNSAAEFNERLLQSMKQKKKDN
jgi:HPr kinase/phosphorylase